MIVPHLNMHRRIRLNDERPDQVGPLNDDKTSRIIQVIFYTAVQYFFYRLKTVEIDMDDLIIAGCDTRQRILIADREGRAGWGDHAAHQRRQCRDKGCLAGAHRCIQ